MQPIEYSIEFERLLTAYKSKKHRIRAYAIELTGLSTYSIAEHFNTTQSTVCYHLS
jgi:hypothetical protein